MEHAWRWSTPGDGAFQNMEYARTWSKPGNGVRYSSLHKCPDSLGVLATLAAAKKIIEKKIVSRIEQ